MKNIQIVQIEAGRALAALLEEPETKSITGIRRATTALVAKLDDVDAAKRRQAKLIEPALEARNAAFAALETLVYTLAGEAFSFAQSTGDARLASHLRLRGGAIERMGFERRLAVAEQVHESLVAELPALAESSVTAERVTALQAAIATARSQLAAPRSVIVARAEATHALETELRALRAIVRNQIDPLFRPLRRTKPALYIRYQGARKVINRPGARSNEAADTPATTVTAATTPVANGGPSGAELKIAA